MHGIHEVVERYGQETGSTMKAVPKAYIGFSKITTFLIATSMIIKLSVCCDYKPHLIYVFHTLS